MGSRTSFLQAGQTTLEKSINDYIIISESQMVKDKSPGEALFAALVAALVELPIPLSPHHEVIVGWVLLVHGFALELLGIPHECVVVDLLGLQVQEHCAHPVGHPFRDVHLVVSMLSKFTFGLDELDVQRREEVRFHNDVNHSGAHLEHRDVPTEKFLEEG
jgi:hypothetical protein